MFFESKLNQVSHPRMCALWDLIASVRLPLCTCSKTKQRAGVSPVNAKWVYWLPTSSCKKCAARPFHCILSSLLWSSLRRLLLIHQNTFFILIQLTQLIHWQALGALPLLSTTGMLWCLWVCCHTCDWHVNELGGEEDFFETTTRSISEILFQLRVSGVNLQIVSDTFLNFTFLRYNL